MQTVIDCMVKIIVTVFEIIFDVLKSFFSDERKTEYDADFLPTGELLSRWNKGISICGRSLTLLDSFKNVLCLAQTGAGKSTCVGIPSCLKLIGRASVCVNDPTGEIAKNVSGAFQKAGYRVIIINYLKPGYGGFNPLHRVASKSDIHQISEQVIYSAMGRGKDIFWNASACMCLNIFIELACSMPAENKNMHSVISLINLFSFNPSAIDAYILTYGDAALVQEYKVLNSYDAKVIQNILATVKAATKIFSDPNVAACTAYDTVSFEECRSVPTVIFFNNNVIGMQRYGVVTSIFFEQFFSHILNTPVTKSDLPVFFICDEASSLYLSSLQITASNIRKARAGILSIYQSYHQVVSQYGAEEAKAFRENCFTTVLLPGQPMDLAKEISLELGQFQYEDEKGVKRMRPLLTPDEVHQLNECLVLSGNRRAVKLPLRPFYNNYALNQLSKLPPYTPENTLPFDTLPALPKLTDNGKG